MVERIRPQPFLDRKEHGDFGKWWAERERKLLENSTHFPYTNYRLASEINRAHGIDFINHIIPKKIAELHQQGLHRRVAIMDLGCGLGFFTDQLRQAFPQDVVVYGTTWMRDDAVLQRRKLVAEAKRLQTAGQNHRLQNIHTVREFVDFSPTMHPNDGKWHSILELRDAPEFDMMIDTMGEISYAHDQTLPPESRGQYFLRILRACLTKLHEGGILYVADLNDPIADIVFEHRQELAEQFGVRIVSKRSPLGEERQFQFIRSALHRQS